MVPNRLSICAFGLSLFGLGLSTLLRVIPNDGLAAIFRYCPDSPRI